MRQRKENKRWAIDRKKLTAGILLAWMLTGMLQGSMLQRSRVQAAEPEWVTVTIDDLTAEEETKVDLTACVPKGMIEGGKIRKAGMNTPVTSVEGLTPVNPSAIGGQKDYYILPDGYQVVSGSDILLYREFKTNVLPGDVICYQRGKELEELKDWNLLNDQAAGDGYVSVKAGGNVTYGCGWNTEKLQFQGYKSDTLNREGAELAGTVLDSKNFTVLAVLPGGDKIKLNPEDLEIEVPSNKENSRQIPLVYKTECEVVIRYRKNPAGGTEASQVKTKLKVTIWRPGKLSAAVKSSSKQNYYVGDTIDKSKLDVKVVWISQLDPTVTKTNSVSDFTLTPETVRQDGINPVTVTYEEGVYKLTDVLQLTGYGVKEVKASYTGGDVVVGQEYDEKKLTVTLVYKDGKEVKLSAGYELPGAKIVAIQGQNTFVVSYPIGGMTYTGTFTVTGVAKTVSKITAEYTGPDIIVGGTISTANVEVYAVYNDGSKVRVFDFLMSSTTAEKLGANKITVTYGGMSTTMTVTGTEKLPTYISAFYMGEAVIAGSDINPNDVSVTAYYNDGTFANVTDFTLSIKTLTGVGSNTVTVTYKKATAPIYVLCIPRVATALEAVYKGPDVEQGSNFSRDYAIVTATFNDGSIEQVTDFMLSYTLVKDIGANTYEITYGGLTAKITVEGYAKTVTGKGTLEMDVSNDLYEDIMLTAVIEGQLVKENMELDAEAYEPDELKRVVRKTTKKGQYLGFELNVDGYEFVNNQYMTMRITVPEGFDPERVAVYYTPNRKSVMARLGGGLVDSNVYEFYAYRSGTYVLLECQESVLEDADLRGTETRKPFICVSGVKPVIKEGDRLELKATLLYAASNVSTEILWSVNNYSVATIASNGVLSAWESGYVEVTAKTSDGKVSYTFEIEVE